MYNSSPLIHVCQIEATGDTPVWALYDTGPRFYYPGQNLAVWCHWGGEAQVTW